MNKNEWAGIYPAMLTPLKEDETLDEETTIRFVNQLLKQGITGLYLTGNTGEGYALDDDVQAHLFNVVVKATQGRCKLIAHVGGTHTRRAIRLARAACASGVDAVSAMAPNGGHYSVNELLDYYRDVAAASNKPMLAYHIPCRSGYDFSLPDLYRLMEIPSIAGMKFTNENCFKLERLVNRFPDKLFFMGCDQMLLQGLSAGAIGGIGTTYNLIAPTAQAVLTCYQAGDYTDSCNAQARINRFVEALLDAPNTLRIVKALAGEVYHWPQTVSPAPGHIPSREVMTELHSILKTTCNCSTVFHKFSTELDSEYIQLQK